jgi:hypothetical protein
MSLLLAAVLAVLSPAVHASPLKDLADHWDARLTAISGKVVVHPVDGSAAFDAEEDMPLEEGDRITTSARSSAELILDGGSLIALRENSDFTLQKTAKKASMFSLSFGSLLAKIEKLGSQRLSVRTASSVAAVRGTEFGIDALENESRIGVFDEGRVEVTGHDGSKQILLPNQETSVVRGQAPKKPVPLKVFLARREQMRAQVVRLQALKTAWKPLTPAERKKLHDQRPRPDGAPRVSTGTHHAGWRDHDKGAPGPGAAPALSTGTHAGAPPKAK